MREWSRIASKLWRILPNRGYLRGLLVGVAAAVEHEDALRSFRFASAIDLGANVGQFTLLLRTINPAADVHAFEPLDKPSGKFRKLFSNDAKVQLYPYAAGDNDGELEIHLSGHEDSSSLLPIGDAQSTIFPGTAEVGRKVIKVRRVDDLVDCDSLERPLLIKLDVQGYELSALEGMPRLVDSAEYIYVELSFVELYTGQPLATTLLAWMFARGFALSGIYNLRYTDSGVAVQADALFSRQAH